METFDSDLHDYLNAPEEEPEHDEHDYREDYYDRDED